MVMDIQGNIGMGYSGMGGEEGKYVSSYYTGRYVSDELGAMTIAEEVIQEGNGNIPGQRYGDYSQLAVDPSNDKTFWYNNELIQGSRANVVGVFQIAANYANDVGVVNLDSPVTGTLTSSENVTVTIFNYGESEASNFDVSFQLNNGEIITETYTGTLGSAQTDQFTFSTTVDMSTLGEVYVIMSSTNMSSDQDNSNDAITSDVVHLNANDIGISEINSPSSGTNLSSSEQVIVTITNYGGATQFNFDVSVDINGTIVTEIVEGPLEGNSSMEYTFNYNADLSAFGNYSVMAYTSLDQDFDNTNDLTEIGVNNANCSPESNCIFGGGPGDGFQLVSIGDINNETGCSEGGYGDYTSISTDLAQGDTYDLTMTTNYGDQNIKVWIDFNDDFIFSADELVVDNFVIGFSVGNVSITETTQVTIPDDAPLGQHIMRLKSNWNAEVPDDSCADTAWGETEDYMVNIVTSLGVEDIIQNESDFSVISLGDNIFDVNLTSSYQGKIDLTVYNVLGQRMVFHRFENTGSYNYNLDLSYVAKGVYLVRIGNASFGKVKKIIVE